MILFFNYYLSNIKQKIIYMIKKNVVKRMVLIKNKYIIIVSIIHRILSLYYIKKIKNDLKMKAISFSPQTVLDLKKNKQQKYV